MNINFVAFSSLCLAIWLGQIFTLFVLTVAAAEAAIGLAILVCFFRNRGTIDGGRRQRDEGLGHDGATINPLCPASSAPSSCGFGWKRHR